MTRDSFDSTAHAQLFTSNGSVVISSKGKHTGHEAIAKRIDGITRNRTTMHIMSSSQIDVIDSTHATGSHYAIVGLQTINS